MNTNIHPFRFQITSGPFAGKIGNLVRMDNGIVTITDGLDFFTFDREEGILFEPSTTTNPEPGDFVEIPVIRKAGQC